jgi:uncharacterized protein (DUF1778 family)
MPIFPFFARGVFRREEKSAPILVVDQTVGSLGGLATGRAGCVDIVYTLLYSDCIYRRKAMPKTDTPERAGRGVTINLRADARKRSLIDRAAERLGKNRSEFMLEAACREATAVLLDQRFFLLDEKTYKRFTTALDKPPAENKRLRRLLMTKAAWEG